MTRDPVSGKKVSKKKMWIGFPLGCAIIGGSFYFSFVVGASSPVIAGLAWCGLILILLQAFYTWSIVFNPMRGVDQPKKKSTD